MQMLGTKPRSPARAVTALDHSAVSPALNVAVLLLRLKLLSVMDHACSSIFSDGRVWYSCLLQSLEETSSRLENSLTSFCSHAVSTLGISSARTSSALVFSHQETRISPTPWNLSCPGTCLDKRNMVEATWTPQRLGLRRSVSDTCWQRGNQFSPIESHRCNSYTPGQGLCPGILVRKNKLNGIFVELLFCFALF